MSSPINPASFFDPQTLLRPRRTIVGMSAILLPFLNDHRVDWESFESHVARTADAGLVPAVNMDTGYANLIDAATRKQALDRTRSVLNGGEFIAGAFVADQPNDGFNLDAYRTAIDEIQTANGTPILFQSYGLAHGTDTQIIANYSAIANHCQRFLAFELGTMFAPFGKIYSLNVYRELLNISACYGAKHSSLNRGLEWQRLQIRNQVRPEFLVLTGNDLAIDMVMYGSDYLLGLSTFCPDWFARRDALWAAGDPKFYQLNDLLQYLGFFAFREPTGGYKHNAAMFLQQRRWLKTDLTHPRSVSRPASDRDVLQEILQRFSTMEQDFELPPHRQT